MRQAGSLTIALTLALALLAAGCGRPATETGEIAREPIRAALAQAERRQLPERVPLAGTVEAGRQAAVSARVMAQVTAVHVAPGDPVRRGQLLAEIDPQAARGQLAQAEGALAQARAALALAERNHRRFAALAERDAASPLEAETARWQYEQARGAVGEAEGAVAAAGSVAADSRVVAPFAGRVAGKLVEVGDLAAPGRPLLILESEGSRRLAILVPESLAAGLALGAAVEVTIDARPELGLLSGTVAERAPADPGTHTIAVKLELPVGDLATGTAGRAWIPAGSREAVVVPEAAVIRQGGIDLVVVVDGEGRAASRAVSLGALLPAGLPEGRWEVLAGLAGGETVALGLAGAPPLGTPVREIAP
jgi:RND family efflux transporter MFP subunit